MKNEDVADLEQIEINIEAAKQLIAIDETLTRLENNKDFQAIILEDFFKTNVVRLVRLKASPQCQDDLNQKFITAQIDAVGQMHQYFTGIRIQGNSARQALERDQEELASILTERG